MRLLLVTLVSYSTNMESFLFASENPHLIGKQINKMFGGCRFIQMDIRSGILLKVENKHSYVYIRFIDTFNPIKDDIYVIYKLNRDEEKPLKTKCYLDRICYSDEELDKYIDITKKRCSINIISFIEKDKCNERVMRLYNKDSFTEYAILKRKLLKEGDINVN